MTVKYDNWIKDHKPIYNQWFVDALHDGTLFRTFGDELRFVKNTIPAQVWTLLKSGHVVQGCSSSPDREGFFIVV